MDKKQATQRFYDMVWPHRADILRVALFLAHDRQIAEDLSQETLLKAFKSIEKVREGAQGKFWLLAILRNTWLDRIRAKSSRPETALEDLPAEPPAPPDDADSSAVWADPQAALEAFSDQQMIDALNDLPVEIRWTVLLVDVEGVGLADAAEVLGVPVGTVKSRAHRGRLMLRDALGRLARELRFVSGNAMTSSLRPEET